MRTIGTVVRGVRAPIIREGDNIAEVAAASVSLLAKNPDHWAKGMILCITVEFYAILSLLASMMMLLSI